MGMEKAPSRGFTPYVHNPSIEEKNKFYNLCDIWLAPTNNEGLHMCPAEAMLTECVVVGTDSPMSGMRDYLYNSPMICALENLWLMTVSQYQK